MVLPSVCYAELFTPLTPASTLPSVGATHLSDPRGSTPLSVSRVWTLTFGEAAPPVSEPL